MGRYYAVFNIIFRDKVRVFYHKKFTCDFDGCLRFWMSQKNLDNFWKIYVCLYVCVKAIVS